MCAERLYLSTPHLGEAESSFVQEAFETNWIAPVGPHIDAFEREFAKHVGAKHAVALSSGTAALHLAVRLCGVGQGGEVLVSDLTFCASVNPIIYEDGKPIFIDSETSSWNLDPNLVEDILRRRDKAGKRPQALIVVHLYGQCADLDPLVETCARYGVTLIEDAAEALGASYKGKAPGTFGKAGIFSFNGNKIITTSGGGMLVTEDGDLAAHARKLATQARDDAPHYEHSEIGYNYRLSNVLAGIGRGQLQVLEDRVRARRRNFELYEQHLGDLPGITFMPEAGWGCHTRWLTCLTIDSELFGADREAVRLALEKRNIEARPVWKPMHLQPAYAAFERVGGAVAERLFERGLCLPSGSNLSERNLMRVVEVVQRLFRSSNS
jgi:pyridoxal phosphate-dependent aminotransferase EpsN